MHRTRADPHHPNLSLGDASAQVIACLQLIRIHLVGTTLDIDGYELTLVVGLELGTDVILVNCVATMREFFFAVMASGRGHRQSPCSRTASPVWHASFRL